MCIKRKTEKQVSGLIMDIQCTTVFYSFNKYQLPEIPRKREKEVNQNTGKYHVGKWSNRLITAEIIISIDFFCGKIEA